MLLRRGVGVVIRCKRLHRAAVDKHIRVGACPDGRAVVVSGVNDDCHHAFTAWGGGVGKAELQVGALTA